MKRSRRIAMLAIALCSTAFAQMGVIGATLRDDDDGVLITDVADGMPADEAGLEPGDIIALVDNQPVGSKEYFIGFVRSNPQRTIRITYLRDGDRYRTDVTIGQMRSTQSSAPSGGSIEARRQYILTQIQILDSKIASQQRSIDQYNQSSSTGATHMMLMNSAYQLLQTYQNQRAQWVQMLNQL